MPPLVDAQPAEPGRQAPQAGTRIAWNQRASSAAELASYTFVLYVNGSPTPITSPSCVRIGAGTTYDCIASLPHLAPGVHSLEVATSTGRGANSRESERSEPALVSVPGVGRAEPRNQETRPPPMQPSVGGLTVELVASGLTQPADLAFANEELIFVAERAGHVRVVRDGRLLPGVALRSDDVQRSAHGGLLSIAVDPQFVRNGFVYALAASETSTGVLNYSLTRFRFAGGVLGEAAVLLERVPAAEGNLAGSLRFGPDGKLYVALGDVGGLRNDRSSYNGKILRLNSDGTTPPDQRSGSPVFVGGLLAPRAMAWRRMERDLWIVEVRPDGARLVHAPLAETATPAASQALPENAVAASISFYDEDLMQEFRGDLLIPSTQPTEILRGQVDPAHRPAVTFLSSVFPDVGAARLVAVSPIGEIYLIVEDRLLKIIPGGTKR